MTHTESTDNRSLADLCSGRVCEHAEFHYNEPDAHLHVHLQCDGEVMAVILDGTPGGRALCIHHLITWYAPQAK